MSQLDSIVKETRAAFIIAKADGVLDAAEVIQIAHGLALKLYGLGGLDINEKKSLLLHTLKKGLDDDGGVDTLAGMLGASTEFKEAFKSHLINAASASVDLILDAYQKMTSKATSWLPAWVWGLLSSCTKTATLNAKDQQLIRDALAFTGGGTDVITLVDVGVGAVDVSGAATVSAVPVSAATVSAATVSAVPVSAATVSAASAAATLPGTVSESN
jgi:hypothetical protein